MHRKPTAPALDELEGSIRSALQQLDTLEDFSEPSETPDNRGLTTSV